MRLLPPLPHPRLPPWRDTRPSRRALSRPPVPIRRNGLCPGNCRRVAPVNAVASMTTTAAPPEAAPDAPATFQAPPQHPLATITIEQAEAILTADDEPTITE